MVANKSLVVGKRFPMEVVTRAEEFYYKGSRTNYKYENGVKTEIVEAVTMDVIDMDTFNRMSVKIEGMQKPLLTNEQLKQYEEAGKKIFVAFEGLTVMPYINQVTNTVADSIKATSVSIIAESK